MQFKVNWLHFVPAPFARVRVPSGIYGNSHQILAGLVYTLANVGILKCCLEVFVSSAKVSFCVSSYYQCYNWGNKVAQCKKKKKKQNKFYKRQGSVSSRALQWFWHDNVQCWKAYLTGSCEQSACLLQLVYAITALRVPGATCALAVLVGVMCRLNDHQMQLCFRAPSHPPGTERHDWK